MTKKQDSGPPAIKMNPYIFTLLLFFFGAWCFYDGWLTTDPEMQEHQLFNRVLSFVLLPWSIYDFFKVKRAYRKNDGDRESDTDAE
jgi:hypothetical protein